jgi:phosphatidylserine synthase
MAAIMAMDLAISPFYQNSFGTYNIEFNVYIMFKTMFFILLIISLGLVSTIRFKNQRFVKINNWCSLFLLIFMSILTWKIVQVYLFHIGRPLPLFCLFIGTTLFFEYINIHDKDNRKKTKTFL